MGHARALLALDDEGAQRRVARDVIARSLSVRETEALVKNAPESGAAPLEGSAGKPVDVHTRAAEDRLSLPSAHACASSARGRADGSKSISDPKTN